MKVKRELKNCPFCNGNARSESNAPWDEFDYTHCLNPDCPATQANVDGIPWRVPIVLWQMLPRIQNG